MKDIMKIESGLLIKGVGETIQNKAKKQKGQFLSMSLGISGRSLLQNLLTGKSTIRAAEGTKRTGEFFLMPPYPLKNFQIQNIIKMNLNLMVFIQEIIYLK